MRCLAIDPGAHCGWCVYDTRAGVISTGTEQWCGFPTVAALAMTYEEKGCSVVVIEEPFVRGGTGPAGWAVGEVCKIFGYLRGRLEASGVPCLPVAAGDWQRAVTGKGRGTRGMGGLVKEDLAARGMLPKRSNPHVRDAIGLALYWAATEAHRVA
jgi:hypothetical protein